MAETLKLKRLIVVGAGITLLCVFLALGNYFMLKSKLEKEVVEKFNQLRNEMPQTAFSGNTSRLLGTNDDKDENNNAVEFEQHENKENKEPLPGHDIVKVISTVNNTLSENIQHLFDMSKLLNEEIGSSQQRLKQIEEEIARMNTNSIKGNSGATEKTQPNAKKENRDNSLKAPTKDEKETKTRKEHHIYFSVALTKTLNNIAVNTVVIFDLVYNNEGFGYDDKTGKFRVPVSGTYLFMFFVEAINEEGKSVHVCLVVDGKYKAAAVAESWHNGQDVTSANTAVTYLTKGQEVWIQTAESHNIVSDIDNRKTTFTGILLFS